MGKRPLIPLFLRAAVLPVWAAGHAMAHHLPPGVEEVDEFAEDTFNAALAHPLSGADHWLAALGIGLIFWAWSRKTGFQSMVLFLLAMAAGIGAGRTGLRLPLMEAGLAASVILVGAAVAGFRWFSTGSVLTLAALTGAWHGIAHGVELARTAPAGLSALGLVLGSAIISLTAAGLTSRLPSPSVQPALPRWTGRGLSAAGLALLVSSFAS